MGIYNTMLTAFYLVAELPGISETLTSSLLVFVPLVYMFIKNSILRCKSRTVLLTNKNKKI